MTTSATHDTCPTCRGTGKLLITATYSLHGNAVVPIPCNMPCPKCGSISIHRKFVKAGREYHTAIENPEQFGPITLCLSHGSRGKQTATIKVTADFIEHTCRCCSYTWATSPLPTTP